MLSMYNTSFLLILKIQIKKRISRQIIMPNLCANRNNFNSKPPIFIAVFNIYIVRITTIIFLKSMVIKVNGFLGF